MIHVSRDYGLVSPAHHQYEAARLHAVYAYPWQKEDICDIPKRRGVCRTPFLLDMRQPCLQEVAQVHLCLVCVAATDGTEQHIPKRRLDQSLRLRMHHLLLR